MEVVDIGSLGTGGAVIGGAVPAEVGALQVGDQESRAVVYPDFQVFYFVEDGLPGVVGALAGGESVGGEDGGAVDEDGGAGGVGAAFRAVGNEGDGKGVGAVGEGVAEAVLREVVVVLPDPDEFSPSSVLSELTLSAENTPPLSVHSKLTLSAGAELPSSSNSEPTLSAGAEFPTSVDSSSHPPSASEQTISSDAILSPLSDVISVISAQLSISPASTFAPAMFISMNINSIHAVVFLKTIIDLILISDFFS